MNMPPRASIDDIPDGARAYAVLAGEAVVGGSIGMFQENVTDGVFTQAGVPVLGSPLHQRRVFAQRVVVPYGPFLRIQSARVIAATRDSLRAGMGSMAISLCSSAFAHGILVIIQTSAEEQMRRVHAVANVAMVTDKQTVRDGAVRQFPRHAMGENRATVFKGELAVAASCLSAHPQPAIARLVHTRPEAILRGKFARSAGTRTKNQLRSRRRAVEQRTAMNARCIRGNIEGRHDDLLSGRCGVTLRDGDTSPEHFDSSIIPATVTV